MDKRLEQLVTELQQHAPQFEERQLVLIQLVDEILRARKICRPLGNQPLFSVYQKIYEQVQQQLLCDIDEQINQYNPKRTNVRVWTNNLRNQAFREILDDVQLKHLALFAQHHPPYTELRQYALGELIEAIRLSGRLIHPHRERFSPQFYELLYDEAVNKTLTYVCQKIDYYDPERGDKKFMNWVNFRLDKILLEISQEIYQKNIITLPSFLDVEAFTQPEETAHFLYENLRDYLEKDYENIFKKAHIKNRPDANFSTIALARLSGDNWQDISKNLGIPLPTLSSFFQRCCKNFRPNFKQYI